MTYIEQQARKENRSFYRSSCGRIVQRVPGQDEFGDPQVTEHYMPVEAAIAMHEELGTALLSERSKPSLMVGFSEEEVERASFEIYPVCFLNGIGGAHDINQQARIHAVEGLRYANTRAVSIDRLVEVVTEWLTHDGREPDNTRQQPMPMSDLRERLMKNVP